MTSLLLAALLALVALIYASVGQAGGTAFLAVMALMGLAPGELRPTALALNVIAAGFTTWQLHRLDAVDWRLLGRLGAPSIPMAFVGGLIVLDGRSYYVLVGLLLITAAFLMVVRPREEATQRPLGTVPALLIGALVGWLSGLTGVGGGVFLAPIMIVAGWASVKQAAALSAPFILINSIVALLGTIVAGGYVTAAFGIYAVAVAAGAAAGTLIGRRFLSERATRYVLAAILLAAGVKSLAG
jgi:uncharacterized membrane protein YfcA